MKIIVTKSDLEQIELLVEDYLSSFHPDIDYSRGTPQNDLLVQGIKVPLALLSSIATHYRQTRSLSGIQELIDALEATDPTDPDVIDAKAEIESATNAILSNWFSEIRSGARARGAVTLHLSSNASFLLPADWRAYRALSIPFVNTNGSDTTITSSDMTAIIDANGLTLEYTYRVMVEAESEGENGDVEPGVWEAFDQVSPFLYQVSSESTFTSGADDETPSEAIARVSDGGVHERTLHNQRSVNARIGADYPSFLPVRVIGAGQPEMQRDLLMLGGTFKMHQLNKWNIYVGGDIYESKISKAQLAASWYHPETDALVQGVPNRAILPFSPILLFREIRYANTSADPSLTPFTDSDGFMRFELLSTETPYTNLNQAKLIPYDDSSLTTWGSAVQAMMLEINPQTFQLFQPEIEIVHDTVDGFETIHTLFDSSDERPGAGLPLAYSYYPAVLSFTLEYVRRIELTSGIDVDAAEAKRLLTAFVRGWKQGNPMFVNAIVQEFLDNYGDIVSGVKPITLSYYAWLPDGTKVEFERNDRVSFDKAFIKQGTTPPPKELVEYQYSDRTMIVYTDEVNIEIKEA